MVERPDPPAAAGWSIEAWSWWLTNHGVVHSVRSSEPQTCGLCNGPTKLNPTTGLPYDRCWACAFLYRPHLQRIVPISFATSRGLTSIIRQAKNEPSRAWLHTPLACLLHTFLRDHLTCLEQMAGGGFHYATAIPSHESTRRGVDHMRQLHAGVTAWPAGINWRHDLLTKTRPESAEHHRNTLDTTLFRANPAYSIAGCRVLLIDDLCTTGSTIASAASAITAAGGLPCVAVTIGRHLRFDHPPSRPLIEALPQRTWDPEECAVHPRLFATPGRPW